MHRLAAALLFLAACSGESAAPPTLVWARSADSATLDPAEIDWGEDIKIVQNLYEPLVSFKGDTLELEGRLATGWTFSADGRTAAFDLRPGVTFHDGSAFTSEAVVFSFQRLMDPGHPHRPKAAPFAANFSNIEKVEASGAHKVVFTLQRPTPVFLQILTLFAADIVSPAAVRKHGPAFGVNPSGTGPYRLARWERDVKMELVAHAGYWGAAPAIPRVIVVPVQSPQTAVQKLQQGEVHVVDHPALGDVQGLRDHPATQLLLQPSLNVCCLGFNLKRAPYDILEFRRAVSLALDRKALNRLAYYGLAQPAVHLVPPAVWGDLPSASEYEYDPARSREILSRLSLPSREIELIHVSIPRPYMPEPHRVAEWVKDQLRQVGLEVKLTSYDKSGYGVKTREDGHPLFLLGWKGDYPDPDNYLYPLLHGDNAGDLNGAFFNDRAFNEAVMAARFETDPVRRGDLYARAHRRYREELPTLPLVHMPQVLALSRRVEYRLHPVEVRFATARFVK